MGRTAQGGGVGVPAKCQALKIGNLGTPFGHVCRGATLGNAQVGKVSSW